MDKDSTDAQPEAEAPSQPIAQEEAKHERQAKAGGRRVNHPSVDERREKGRLACAKTPPSVLAGWTAGPDRADPVGLLEGQESSRVQPLVPVRHQRMSASAFAFYRGGALLMAADLATTPNTGLAVQLCGDAHLSNFGLFAAPDRTVIFDVNDFDETHPGPFEWDVKRLATSFVLAARDNGLDDSVGRAAAETAAASYRTSMADFSQMTELDIWYDRIDSTGVLAALQEGLAEADAVDLGSAAKGKAGKKSKKDKKDKKAKDKKGKAKKDKKGKAKKDKVATKAGKKVDKLVTPEKAVTKAVARAQARDAWSAIEKLTEVVDGRRQFRDDPPLLIRTGLSDELQGVLNTLFRQYRATLQDDRRSLLKRYQIIDFGHKVVGVGSVGLLAFVMLMQGRDEDDLMVLQVKQAQASVLEAYTSKSVFSKHGHRVVTGQRLMQAASDSFLGWIDGPSGRGFYIRQLRDMKWSPDPASLGEKQLIAFASLCGHTLARAHARSGDAVAISTYLESDTTFDAAIGKFAMSYADTAAEDYEAFMSAIASGRLDAHEGSSGVEAKEAIESLRGPALKAAGLA
ncbi:MAG: DUF2252 domain-containing protein [Candidatus Nanopelagicales bacterium]